MAVLASASIYGQDSAKQTTTNSFTALNSFKKMLEQYINPGASTFSGVSGLPQLSLSSSGETELDYRGEIPCSARCRSFWNMMELYPAISKKASELTTWTEISSLSIIFFTLYSLCLQSIEQRAARQPVAVAMTMRLFNMEAQWFRGKSTIDETVSEAAMIETEADTSQYRSPPDPEQILKTKIHFQPLKKISKDSECL